MQASAWELLVPFLHLWYGAAKGEALPTELSRRLHIVLSVGLLRSLSSTGSILSNTDLSDLSTVGTCDIFVYQMRHRVM